MRMTRGPLFCALAGVVLTMVAAHAAFAHSVKCFAAFDGKEIAGYAWMGGGTRAREVPFHVVGPDGAVLLRGVTDGEGEFRFVPSNRCDHGIVIEAGAGHRAEFTVPAAELPTGLPRYELHNDGNKDSVQETGETATSKARAGLSEKSDDLEAALDRVVSRRIAPLRRDIAELADRKRMQDALAGIGYILGLTGIVFYFLGARRNRR